ncbi:MAG TPA: glutamine synthetase family protein [Gaiellales bacterium]|nr:glutamine synthetase family protein [Gaiellales bacterium]
MSIQDLAALTAELKAKGVRALTVTWCDSNGIQRSRSAPIDKLSSAVERGMGCSFLFAVFDSHDHIHWGVEGLETATGDFRVKAVPDRIVQLAGQPAFAWAPAQLWLQEGPRWEHCYRAALERIVERAKGLGYEFKAGLELEWFIGQDSDEPVGAHRGPVYSPNAMLDVSEFLSELLADLDDNGLTIGQVHAEYAWSQLEVSLDAKDPVAAADDQLLARETIRAAARANGLRASFAPLVTPQGVGNGWHFHVSIHKDGRNLLSGGDGPEGMTPEGEAFVAGILRDLRGVVAVAAPSVPSLIRLRPGYFASAYAFWGPDNREASLRFVPGAEAIGAQNANIELKASDASGNPYLGLTAMLASGLGGIEDGLTLPEPIVEDPGNWTPEEREARGVQRFAQDVDEQIANFEAAPRIRAAFGDPLANAFAGVRRSDGAWAEGKSAEEIVAAHLWRY